MNLRLKQNKTLFLLQLIITFLENDCSFSVLKKETQFSKKILNELTDNDKFLDIINLLLKLKIDNISYIRIVNYFFNTGDINQDLIKKSEFKLLNQKINKILQNELLSQIFQKHLEFLKLLEHYNLQYFKEEVDKLNKFFGFNKPLEISVDIHLNTIEVRGRATNYYMNKEAIVSIPLINNKINFSSFRHEMMHLYFKKLFKGYRVDNLNLSLPKSYANDDLRVLFEELFITAANLFFIKDVSKRNNNLRFLYDQGYFSIYLFFNFIDNTINKNGEVLNKELLIRLSDSLKENK